MLRITDIDIKKVEYTNIITLLKAPGNFNKEMLRPLHEYAEREITKDLHTRMADLKKYMLPYGQILDDLFENDPANLETMLETIKADTFKYYAYLFVGLEKISELRSYLRELRNITF